MIKTSTRSQSWNKFGKKTIKKCHDLYLKCDVLFADVFEKLRNTCLENYSLCSGYYLSAPALSWDAKLTMNKVELHLPSHVDMYLDFFRRCKWWCFSYS